MPAYTNCSDEELFSFIKHGDEAAFNELFSRYRSKLYYYLVRHTKNREIAEEIVVDIFMKLWIGRALVAQVQAPAAFFHKLAYYKAMDFLRTTARHARLQEIYASRKPIAEAKKPDDLLIDSESKALLLQAINQLPPKRKLVYQLSRQEGLTHEEIATLLHLSKSTVNNTITAATVSIAEFLRKNLSGKAALTSALAAYLCS